MAESSVSSNHESFPMSTLKTGERARIAAVSQGVFSARLRDLGFVPGSVVVCRQKAPFSDPVEYEVRGSRFCLRNSEAKDIHVEVYEEGAAAA